VEILERFTYYGIYIGFGVYITHLGFKESQLGVIQSIFLFSTYLIPIFAGTLADKYGFKRLLIVSYLAYLPSILLLLFTKTFSGIALSMLCIGFAAGIFKPLIAGTIRAVTDKTNKTVGFGIFYGMINVGATFGPIVAGYLRAMSWNYVFIASAISVGIMLLVTILFYKEPPRDIQGETVGKKLRDIGIVLSDVKFSIFLILVGLFFWVPLWAFININSIYIDKYLDTADLYVSLKSIFGTTIANFVSHPDEHDIWRVLGESIASSAPFIILFQYLISYISEKFNAMYVFITGMLIAALGFLFLAMASFSIPSLVFLGIFFYAVGEMCTSPRIQEYITWLAPKEKAGLYVGTHFLATGLGGTLSGVIYTSVFGWFREMGHPEYVWYVLAAHFAIGAFIIHFYTKSVGHFKELEA
jgi:MFS family permease